MKKIISVIVVLVLLSSCSTESNFDTEATSKTNEVKLTSNETNPSLAAKGAGCPEGQHAELVFEFDAIRLHRKSAGCSARFSICSDGHWEIQCVDNLIAIANPSYNYSTAKATIHGEPSADGTSIKLRFPIELLTAPTFTSSDFVDFGFDTNYDMGHGYIIKAGNYKPTYTSKEIQVIVPLLP